MDEAPDHMAEMASQMKADWNDRATKNAEYYIASTNFASAEQVASLFADVTSPQVLVKRLQTLGLEDQAFILTTPLWFAWRRSIAESR